MLWFGGYIVAINIVGYVLFGSDKSRAVKGQRRIPEKYLFATAAFGGAAGAWLGMKSFRHKTKHVSFTLGLPVLFGINMLSAYYVGKALL